MLYFAVVHHKTDGGIVISASHNPAEYNGMKLVRQHAAPVSADTGLLEVRDAIENGDFAEKEKTHCRAIPKPIPFLNTYSEAPPFIYRLAAIVQSSELSSMQIMDLLDRSPNVCYRKHPSKSANAYLPNQMEPSSRFQQADPIH